jgi:hypothetical protein
MAGLKSITNIVVLMFENRSFDNIFGNLYPNGSTVNGYSFEGMTFGTTPTRAITRRTTSCRESSFSSRSTSRSSIRRTIRPGKRRF